MTIEIQRKHARYKYRINPYNARVIDYKVNRHGARWLHYRNYDTAQEAREAVLKLEKGNATS